MATEAQIAKSRKSRIKPKYSSRVVRRCWRCGRKRAYMRDFDLCRICFRELATKGEIPGVRKSSW
ncbi:MAG: type Z 30S ribosomal protein S14 [Candidatus Kerfeldbacteria bacterium]|nr:type Z 30S ribosomal protein S14 [Candidatus Kerfeldbacteria bacterium]